MKIFELYLFHWYSPYLLRIIFPLH